MNSAGPAILGLGLLGLLAFAATGDETATGGGGGGGAPAPSGPPQTPFAEKEAAALQAMIEQAVASGSPTQIRATATKIRNTAWSSNVAAEAKQAADDLDALALSIEQAQGYGQSGQGTANMPDVPPYYIPGTGIDYPEWPGGDGSGDYG